MIRQFAGVKPDEPLDPYRLAKHVKLLVVDLDRIQGLSEESRKQLTMIDPRSWSGGTTKPLPNGWRLVVLNPMHGRERNAATLMEEICHVILGHSLGRVNVESENGVGFRDYNAKDEEAAYAVGAAALLPYYALHQAVHNGMSAEQIAARFGVSKDLVEYRIKVTRLWETYQKRLLNGAQNNWQ